MNSSDFQNGLEDAAELCEREAPKHIQKYRGTEPDWFKPEAFNYRRAAQACREAVKLRGACERVWLQLVCVYGRSGGGESLNELRKALGKR